MRPVFDEDGKMYSNECVMRASKCKGKKKDVDLLKEYKRLYGESFGASREGDAGDSEETVDDSASNENGIYRDESASEEDGSDEVYCPNVMCPAVYSPVWDENGVKYSNECAMKAAKCEGKRKNVDILEEYKRLYGKSFGARVTKMPASKTILPAKIRQQLS